MARRPAKLVLGSLLIALVAIGGLSGTASAKKKLKLKKGSYYVGCTDITRPTDCQNRFGLKVNSRDKVGNLWFVKDPAVTCKYIWGGTHNADDVKFTKIKKGKFSGELLENDRVFELPQGDPGQVDAIWKIKGVFKSAKRAELTFTPTLSKDGFCTADQLTPFTITYRFVAGGS